MTNSNYERQWSVWYSVSKTGSRVCLKVKEKQSLIRYDNNPPPDVGFQPYTGDDNDGDEG